VEGGWLPSAPSRLSEQQPARARGADIACHDICHDERQVGPAETMDLIDRDDDRQALDQLVDAAREGISGSLVLRGEPGIGKTLLLDYAADRATGMQLARVTAIESEMELVSDRVADINARSLAHPGAGYITISPLHFNLAPGKSELIQIRANMPASVHGDHYANTVFAAAPAHPGRGTMHVAGAVASSVEIHAPATTTRGTHTGPPAASGLPLPWLAGILIAAAALVLALVARIHRRGSSKHGLPGLT